MALIAHKNATLARLRRALFGNGTESLENLLAILASQEPTPDEGSSTDDLTPAPEPSDTKAEPASEPPEGSSPT